MEIRKKLILERVEKFDNDINTLKLNSKYIKDIINDYDIMPTNAFNNKYPRLNMNIDELKLYRRLINKRIKTLKELESHD